jgi:hypothetical protein
MRQAAQTSLKLDRRRKTKALKTMLWTVANREEMAISAGLRKTIA